MRLVTLVSVFLVPFVSQAQFGRGSWTTFGGDPQRTGWNRSENELSAANVKSLKLEWTVKLDSQPKELTGPTTPLVRATMATPRGVKDLVVVAGAADKVFVIDGDTGKIYWQKTLTIEGTPERGASWLCPNALNATPAIGPAPRTASAVGGPGMGGQALYVLASDGKLHAFNLVSGEDILPPTPFVPPFAKAWSLNLANGFLYATTSQGCNGVKSGVYGMDLNDAGHKTAWFQTGTTGSGIWGRAGAAIASDGRIIVETGDGPNDVEKGFLSDSVIGISPRDLKLADYFTPANRSWITKKDLDMGSIGPTVFRFKTWELAAAGGKEGVIFLLDTRSLGGADHRTPLYRSPLYTNEEVNFATRGFWGSFSTWEDPSGTRWLYAPAWGPPTSKTSFPIQYGETPNGSVMAFKVELRDDKPSLTPAWNSVDMSVPSPVVIANGLVFAMSDGDYAPQFGAGGNLLSTQQRLSKTGHSVIYALEAPTGKVLFSSGDTIKGFSHFSAPAVAGGRVYTVTRDGTLYAFGLGIPQP
ncbi:MAG TPA: PQQ-binding-like beta-propeller repeat protein [Bryobacteraceae bacterium]|nr:PQQ-binding-like beta-propeller repeat protein [Bryobacteraceae bacterium]